MKEVIEVIRQAFRRVIRQIAVRLNSATSGKITPNQVTLFCLLMHLPIAILIARGRFVLAGILLLVFGLFDVLDGELSRVQKRESNVGGLLDAATDRFKEVMLYAGATYFLASGEHPTTAVWALLACGASLSVSYIKSKGETMVASLGKKLPYSTLNKMFADGIMPFELRMFVLILGLLTGLLIWAVILIAVLAIYTSVWRLIFIAQKLR